jgi:tryptophanyl-tRNA synthetase
MEEPETKIVLPIRDDEKNAASEQQIDPWGVQAAQDEHGNVLAFDYVAISQYAQVPYSMA